MFTVQGESGGSPEAGYLHEHGEVCQDLCTVEYNTVQYIILDNEILKFNSSVLSSSYGYI